ncbi:MAG TPA: prolipoprotein diacylglyceryl transferase [Candidatus Limadaptatus stercoravium]|nr:prolipoprotein diacylglyceryl transferase [Candidatus Limadaptatus stercoravium]
MNLLSAINKIAFTIGNLEVAWYGIIIVIGMIAGLTIICFECKRVNLNVDDAVELFLWVIPLAVVFCRVFYVGARPDVYFPVESWSDFVDLIAIWDGGITIIGGLVGGLIGASIFAYRMRRKCNFGNVVDLIVVPLLTGQIIGRLGNFVNQEAFGIPITDPRLQTFPFAVWIDQPQGVEPEYHDLVYSNVPGWFAATFFYEMVWNFIGACIFFAIWRKNKRFPGILGFCYFFWYFLGRAWLESLRIDAVPVTQVACIVVVPVALLLGAAYILVCMSRQSFRKVNNAVKDGRLGITELDSFDVANYKFALRRIAKGGAFFRRFYEADDVPVAKLDDGDYIKKVRVAWKLPKYPAEKISSEEKKQ